MHINVYVCRAHIYTHTFKKLKWLDLELLNLFLSLSSSSNHYHSTPLHLMRLARYHARSLLVKADCTAKLSPNCNELTARVRSAASKQIYSKWVSALGNMLPSLQLPEHCQPKFSSPWAPQSCFPLTLALHGLNSTAVVICMNTKVRDK